METMGTRQLSEDLYVDREQGITPHNFVFASDKAGFEKKNLEELT